MRWSDEEDSYDDTRVCNCKQPHGPDFTYVSRHYTSDCPRCGAGQNFCAWCGECHCDSRSWRGDRSLCQECNRLRWGNQDCATQHACSQGCGARFCTHHCEPGLTYVRSLTRQEKRFLPAELKDACLDCLVKVARREPRRRTAVRKTYLGLGLTTEMARAELVWMGVEPPDETFRLGWAKVAEEVSRTSS